MNHSAFSNISLKPLPKLRRRREDSWILMNNNCGFRKEENRAVLHHSCRLITDSLFRLEIMRADSNYIGQRYMTDT
jgi:hypothetical protein